MTEAMLDSFRSTRAPAAPPRAINGAPLNWTPGPDERRLPSCEDEPVPQNTVQAVAVEESFGALRQHWRGRRDVFVGQDQFLYWDPAYDSRRNKKNPPAAPDVYVAFDVANRHHRSYVMWEEGKPPDFVLEVVSPSSRRRDMKEKPEIYAKIGVPELFLYDPGDEKEQELPGFVPALAGFELLGGRGGKYRPLPEEELPVGVVGVRSKLLGLCLCVQRSGPEPLDGFLRWYDPATGRFLPTRHQWADDHDRLTDDNQRLADAKQQAEARAKAADAKAEAAVANAKTADASAKAAVARVAELEALVEKMRRG